MKMAHVDGGLHAGRRLIEVSFGLSVSCHAKEVPGHVDMGRQEEQ